MNRKHKAGVLSVCATDEDNKPVVIDLREEIKKTVLEMNKALTKKEEPAESKPDPEPEPGEGDEE